MVSVSRAPYFSLSIFFIPRSFVLRWLPHSVLPIGIILIYFCFVLILPSLVIILYLSLQTATSAQTKQHFFTYAKQHLSAYIKQLCSYRNNKQQLNNLLLPTCSLFQPINHLFCVPFTNNLYNHSSFHNHLLQQFNQPFHQPFFFL